MKSESIPFLILKLLTVGPLPYSDIKRWALAPTRPKHIYYYTVKPSERYLSVVLQRLRKQDLVIKDHNSGNWKLTASGVKRISEKHSLIPRHSKRSKKPSRRNCIVIFDIPESDKRKRHWLRLELICLGFEQLQKSVWIGEGPMPEEFIRVLDDMGILNFVQIFTIEKSGSLPR